MNIYNRKRHKSSTHEGTVQLNLDDLRERLTGRLAVLIIATAQLMILFYESPEPFPVRIVVLWLVLTGLGIGTLWLNGRSLFWAGHTLVWSTTAAMLLAMWFFPVPWLPFLGISLLFSHAILVQGSEFVSGTIFMLGTVIMARFYDHPYAVEIILINMILAVTFAWMTIRALYTALEWLSRTQNQAEYLLDVTRNQQAELRSQVKSLQLVTNLRLQAEQDLLIANKNAREAQRMKEQFAANISHEFRTPLSIILGFSEVMYLTPEVYGAMHWPPKLMRDINQVYRNSRHLMSMIDDILDLSRFEISVFSLNLQPTAVGPLLQEAVDIAADLFRSETVDLQVEFELDLPLLDLDRTRMRQVILNLLNNAFRFTEKGTIRLRAFRHDGELHICVADTGPGIALEERENIFQEFYQIDYSLSRKHGGAGLGLAICQRFVQAHDGRIWVESESGAGATFTISLPLTSHMPSNQLIHTAEGPRARSPDRPRIIFVDSDQTSINIVQRHLRDFEVLALTDPAELETAVLQNLPVGVLWNVLPGEENVAEVETTVPIVTCTLPSRSWMAEEIGVLACLQKPIDFDLLNQTINALPDLRSVLVVDDNEGVCQLIERGLSARPRPLRVRLAYDGTTGLQVLRQDPPDLLLLDLVMPGMDGRALLEEIRADELLSGLQVVLLSATDMIEPDLGGRGNRIHIFRAQSLQPAELLQCVQPIFHALTPRYGETAVAVAGQPALES